MREPRRFPRVIAIAVLAAFWFVARGAAVEPQGPSGNQASGASSGGLEVLEVRPNFFMIAGAGANIGVQVGEDGVVVVDAGSAASAPAVVAAIKRITPKPIRYVIDTGPDADHVGGNDVLSKAGDQFFPGTTPAGPRQDALRSAAAILAAEGVVRHMTEVVGIDARRPLVGLPTESFHYARKYLYLNDEAIEVLHQPAAHTDSDVFVVLPALGCRRCRRRDRHAPLSRHRHRARRQHRGRDRGAEPFESNSQWRRCPSCRARRARS